MVFTFHLQGSWGSCETKGKFACGEIFIAKGNKFPESQASGFFSVVAMFQDGRHS
jgi:hypothetical protein